ncbi:MAG TPA: hypothetical protein VFD21_02785 [Vicinamibacterales bacterium]|jgi:hypothetical protein|nr:hypothetical protein [Vicinamibacterales bacterium]
MSRVVFADNAATPDQELLREAHQVRVVSEEEEGNGVNALPGGVYGFTYSPGLQSAPLFAIRRYRSYETHKLPSGDVFIVGFAKSDVARELSTATQEMTLQIHPQPEGEYQTLMTIPYSRIRHHRQYAAPNQDGFTVTVQPAEAAG